MLLEELAEAGGRIVKSNTSGPNSVNWSARVSAARRSGRIPETKELYGRWCRGRLRNPVGGHPLLAHGGARTRPRTCPAHPAACCGEGHAESFPAHGCSQGRTGTGPAARSGACFWQRRGTVTSARSGRLTVRHRSIGGEVPRRTSRSPLRDRRATFSSSRSRNEQITRPPRRSWQKPRGTRGSRSRGSTTPLPIDYGSSSAAASHTGPANGPTPPRAPLRTSLPRSCRK